MRTMRSVTLIPVLATGMALALAAKTLKGQAKPADEVPSPVFDSGQFGVTSPRLIHPVQAEYSDAARRAKYQGVCLVQLIVDEHGRPRDVHEIRPLGMDLDENAIKAVKMERFIPGTYNGRPVAVRIATEVSFKVP